MIESILGIAALFFLGSLLIKLLSDLSEILKNRRKPLLDERYIYIYILIDPNTHLVKYVGQSVNPYARLKQHAKDRYGFSPKQQWISSLKGVSPLMAIVDQAESQSRANKMEEYWIQLFWKYGAPLTNTSLMAETKKIKQEKLSVAHIR